MAVYKTVSGDTWDLIAYKQLGSEKYMKELMDANWELTDVLVFEAGTELVLPEITLETESDLPFWHSDDDNSAWAAEVTA